ncbi:MAG: glycerate kinase [Rhizobiaceae bacterium]
MISHVDHAALLRRLFDCAVATADPMRIVPAHLPAKPEGRVVVVGAGKASARMAEALESVWGPCEGLVITRYGYGRPCEGIEIVEASHPVPDQAGFDATRRMLDLVQSLGEDDLVIALISGGASALLIQPADGVSLAEKQAVNAALLASGAPIGEMNVVRKHLSLVKGGQLAAAAWPARVIALMISDVPGDDPALIGSGPTVPDRSTVAEARDILARWSITAPPAVLAALSRNSSVVSPDDRRIAHVENKVIAAPMQSLQAAEALAREAGHEVRILSDRIEGEARAIAAAQANLALEIQSQLKPDDRPVLLLSGGELTVTRRGDGIGGPNAEFMLAMAIALDGAPAIWALACDTDGVDGAAEVAGAVIDETTMAQARAKSLDPSAFLERNDSHTFFQILDAQVVSGPTLTNVNDFRAILIYPR